MPYWLEDDSNKSAKAKLAGVVALTLGTTGVRCARAQHPEPRPAQSLETTKVYSTSSAHTALGVGMDALTPSMRSLLVVTGDLNLLLKSAKRGFDS
jgi:hypothetical protein